MALKPITKPEYQLTDENDKPVTGFEEDVFGPSSNDYLNQPQAVTFTREQEMIPQSLLEAIAVRAYSGDPKSWKFQRTRTDAICGVRKGEVYVAFDDIPDAKKNLVIAKAQKAYNLNTSRPRKELIIRGKTLSKVLERAEKDERVLPYPKDGHVVANTAEYGTNPHFVAMEGCMAPVNARLIQSKGRNEGRLALTTLEYVLKHVKEGEAMVLPLGLGGGDFSSISSVDYVFAYGVFDGGGLVRGVRGARDFSTRNKGCLVGSAK
ncbi:Uncharacterised protein [uncultured archaeon]|nr:Uncharacterised protein [uncultured archaeon]